VADLATAKASVAELQAALSSARQELAAARASATAKQVQLLLPILACLQVVRICQESAGACMCNSRQSLVAAVQSQADMQDSDDKQVEAQHLSKAQRSKLLAEINRLQTEQTEATSSRVRQMEALQVPLGFQAYIPWSLSPVTGCLFTRYTWPGTCTGTAGGKAAAAADAGRRAACKCHCQRGAQRCGMEGQTDDDEGRGGPAQDRV
jgi:multidrug efflux pump subunit AcrA (membrane-fusion protein)